MTDGFIRVAAATPKIKVADCIYNSKAITKFVMSADKDTALIVFPELCITGYTCGDLFLQKILLNSAEEAVRYIAQNAVDFDGVIIVGLPVAVGSHLYNCAAIIQKGKLLGLVPKINLPTYSEFYEARHFTAGLDEFININFAGFFVPLCSNLIFRCKNISNFVFGVEICEDLWVAEQPSIRLTKQGVILIANLSASDEAISKDKFRRDMVSMQSARLCAGYIYSDAGEGESSTDLVFSGQNIIAENGIILSESQKFTTGILYADFDLARLIHDRRRMTTFTQIKAENVIEFEYSARSIKLKREFSRTPFVPSITTEKEKRCEDILNIQASGLMQRISATGCGAVIGLSGGLDSALALIVTVKSFDRLGLDKKNIHVITMPCFGTTSRTLSNAKALALAYGTTLHEINITEAVECHLSDILHDGRLDITYENAQARERTQVLMDMANKYNCLVIGTGDMSELALGWATYNGDHMSMYGVNLSIPKTLVRYLVAYEALRAGGKIKKVLEDVLETPVSPELLPPTNGEISQKTEDLVGPYELHDFFLYYFLRFGYPPSKIYRVAKIAFKGAYDEAVILKWLKIFIKRFFAQQFKRSCLPDGPRVGSVSLSPRGDWRMPSDASVQVWMNDLDTNIKK
ncbi:MAG: NAD(+) synthase [Clostridiales bacterium GWF2_38_85]|nr:MAG: NAD(+) synthase [Clostridiales bacterium GWF2_38_85]HBL84116.1 NAD(+) synthase [Clostridiales bacterium]